MYGQLFVANGRWTCILIGHTLVHYTYVYSHPKRLLYGSHDALRFVPYRYFLWFHWLFSGHSIDGLINELALNRFMAQFVLTSWEVIFHSFLGVEIRIENRTASNKLKINEYSMMCNFFNSTNRWSQAWSLSSVWSSLWSSDQLVRENRIWEGGGNGWGSLEFSLDRIQDKCSSIRRILFMIP